MRAARRILLEAVRSAALLAGAPARRAFERALEDPARAQDAVLRRAVAELARTRYGASLGLLPDDGYHVFAAKVPVVDYDALRPWVEAQRSLEDGALVSGPVRFYERTSGSSGGAKDVPYGDALWRTFQRAFALWLGDLLRLGPRLETGRCWISVSPWSPETRATERGVKVGLDDDGEYVKGWLGRALRLFWTVPPEVREIAEPRAYKHEVAVRLLADADLEIVSIWNPTLFLVLLGEMRAHRAELVRRVPARAAVLRRALEAGDWAAVWPRLKLISCWDMGEASRPAAELASLFPGVLLQGKGHLSTESPISIPWLAARACLPLADSVFLEFEDAEGRIRRLHELSEGCQYAVIATPPGGFARYRLGDRVRAGARYKGTHALSLVGRCDDVCDLVGEKLDGRFVADALEGLCGAATFRTLVPIRLDGAPARYALLLDRPGCAPEELDAALRASPLYAHARAMGQLAAPTVSVRPDAAESFALAHSARWGAVKPAALVRDPEVGRALAGSLDL